MLNFFISQCYSKCKEGISQLYFTFYYFKQNVNELKAHYLSAVTLSCIQPHVVQKLEEFLSQNIWSFTCFRSESGWQNAQLYLYEHCLRTFKYGFAFKSFLSHNCPYEWLGASAGKKWANP